MTNLFQQKVWIRDQLFIDFNQLSFDTAAANINGKINRIIHFVIRMLLCNITLYLITVATHQKVKNSLTFLWLFTDL